MPVRATERPEADVERQLDTFLGDGHQLHNEVWVFVYGALLWNDLLQGSPKLRARVHGLHRQFCLWQYSHRGNLNTPCLMLGLDHGGCCDGMVYRVPGPEVRSGLRDMWCREMSGGAYNPRWVKARTGQGIVRALVFVIDRTGPRYASRLTEQEIAGYIADGCGPEGECAEYLRRTVDALAKVGIVDGHLRRLDEMVANRMVNAR